MFFIVIGIVFKHEFSEILPIVWFGLLLLLPLPLLPGEASLSQSSCPSLWSTESAGRGPAGALSLWPGSIVCRQCHLFEDVT